MYRLKPDIDLEQLFDCVYTCSSDVYFQTQDGDNLNLKSQLSHYVLMIVSNNYDFLSKGYIQCYDPADYTRLKDYIIQVS